MTKKVDRNTMHKSCIMKHGRYKYKENPMHSFKIYGLGVLGASKMGNTDDKWGDKQTTTGH